MSGKQVSLVLSTEEKLAVSKFASEIGDQNQKAPLALLKFRRRIRKVLDSAAFENLQFGEVYLEAGKKFLGLPDLNGDATQEKYREIMTAGRFVEESFIMELEDAADLRDKMEAGEAWTGLGDQYVEALYKLKDAISGALSDEGTDSAEAVQAA